MAINLVQILTTKLVFLFNVLGFGSISIVAMFILHGNQRVNVLGWICMIFALSVFVAPLAIVVRTNAFFILYLFCSFDSIHKQKLIILLNYIVCVLQRKVIKTKSVEFMPISLSFFLTLSAVMWFLYGFLRKDYFVAVSS